MIPRKFSSRVLIFTIVLDESPRWLLLVIEVKLSALVAYEDFPFEFIFRKNRPKGYLVFAFCICICQL
jgi:hypothetical protein